MSEIWENVSFSENSASNLIWVDGHKPPGLGKSLFNRPTSESKGWEKRNRGPCRIIPDKMQIELKHIHTRMKRTMIYVTHDREEALVMSDRIVLMNHGRFEQIGQPEELYENPVKVNQFVAWFIGESNIIEGRVVECVDGVLSFRLEDGQVLDLPFIGRAGKGDLAALCVRPEKIFFTSGDEGLSSLSGRIEEVIYVGETIRFQVRINSDLVIKLRELSNQFEGCRMKGEECRITLRPENLKLLSDSSKGQEVVS